MQLRPLLMLHILLAGVVACMAGVGPSCHTRKHEQVTRTSGPGATRYVDPEGDVTFEDIRTITRYALAKRTRRAGIISLAISSEPPKVVIPALISVWDDYEHGRIYLEEYEAFRGFVLPRGELDVLLSRLSSRVAGGHGAGQLSFWKQWWEDNRQEKASAWYHQSLKRDNHTERLLAAEAMARMRDYSFLGSLEPLLDDHSCVQLGKIDRILSWAAIDLLWSLAVDEVPLTIQSGWSADRILERDGFPSASTMWTSRKMPPEEGLVNLWKEVLNAWECTRLAGTYMADEPDEPYDLED